MNDKSWIEKLEKFESWLNHPEDFEDLDYEEIAQAKQERPPIYIKNTGLSEVKTLSNYQRSIALRGLDLLEKILLKLVTHPDPTFLRVLKTEYEKILEYFIRWGIIDGAEKDWRFLNKIPHPVAAAQEKLSSTLQRLHTSEYSENDIKFLKWYLKKEAYDHPESLSPGWYEDVFSILHLTHIPGRQRAALACLFKSALGFLEGKRDYIRQFVGANTNEAQRKVLEAASDIDEIIERMKKKSELTPYVYLNYLYELSKGKRGDSLTGYGIDVQGRPSRDLIQDLKNALPSRVFAEHMRNFLSESNRRTNSENKTRLAALREAILDFFPEGR